MVFEQLTAALPGWQLVVFIVICFTFLLGSGITVFIVMMNMKWNFRAVITEDISGTGIPEITGRDRARRIAFGDGGEEIFLLRNRKKYRSGHGKRIGRNQIMWVIGDDQIWYNSVFGNFNKSMREVGLIPIDRNVRYTNAQIRKGVERRYPDKSFLEKYGTIISIFLILIMICAAGVSYWYNSQKQLEIANTQLEITKQNAEAIKSVNNILQNADTIIHGGSGIIPANK